MYASRAITRTLQLTLRQRTGALSVARPLHAASVADPSSTLQQLKRTAVSAQTSTSTVAPPDFVRLGIQRMLEEAQQHSNNSADLSFSKTLQDAQQQALELVKEQLEETSLCIADCREAVDAESFQEEFNAADAALEKAVLAFAYWLEDARNVDTESSTESKALREANCKQIKVLRTQLDQLKAAQP